MFIKKGILSKNSTALQRRNLRPPKHKFEDYRETSVVDPAGPSKPSKTQLGHCQQSIIVSEEQVTSLSGLASREEIKERLSPDSADPVHLERKLSRPAKNVKQPRRKDVSVPKRKGSKDEAEAVQVVSLHHLKIVQPLTVSIAIQLYIITHTNNPQQTLFITL